MPIIKYTYFVLSLVFSLQTKAQEDKIKIIAAFNKIDYYPDSVIKCAYHVKKGLYEGYAIEFDSTGDASKIGKYKKGKQDGSWKYKSGMYELYDKGEYGGLAIPGCGTGRAKSREDFNNLYLKLLASPKKKKSNLF